MEEIRRYTIHYIYDWCLLAGTPFKEWRRETKIDRIDDGLGIDEVEEEYMVRINKILISFL
ncbi:hypothetical protein E0485_05290 [Paenibacillus albiflavus]|uniref:Uncharacterized protein n=1 Tax=Paenibacillus albiflavus TaxID=2545760 RepID=A0A4R4EIR3_9BACL|nr:hypothetical protein [Paenibacillus albiflavus]TCZ79283.1 hypothetical protein E0485_05290 [Paenibacillus albiflavus]